MLKLSDFIGQERIKSNLNLYVNLITQNKTTSKNIIFNGNAGMGKTTLALLYAKDLNKDIKILQGPLLKTISDLTSVLIDMDKDEILFIDEIHSINKNVEELLYSLMDFNKISIILNKEFTNNIIDINVPNFTLIGSTTQISKLTKPLISRFDYIANMEDYVDDEINKIIEIFFLKKDIKLNTEELKLIKNFTINNPRVIKKFLTKIYEVNILENNIKKSIKKSVKMLDLYNGGLVRDQINYLSFLKINGESGYKTIANNLKLNDDYILKDIEPLLFDRNYIIKSHKGRNINKRGLSFLKTQ